MIRAAPLALACIALAWHSIEAPAQSTVVQATFDECNLARARMIEQLRVKPHDIIPLVDTSIATITRICVADGSVLVTCSRPDQKMIIQHSPHSTDVGCRR